MSAHPQQFLDHLHCCVCYRSYAPNDLARAGTAVPGGVTQEAVPFWITNCMHVLCQHELRDTRREELDYGQIRATCPVCHSVVEMIRLGVEDLPERVQQYFQPIQSSIMDLVRAYEFQFQHMAELIRFFKRQTLKQKEVLEHVRVELAQARATKLECEELRRENKLLLEQMRAMTSIEVRPSPDSLENIDVKPLLDANFGLTTGGPLGVRDPYAQSSSRKTFTFQAPKQDTASTLEAFRHPPPRQQTASSSDAFAFHPPALRTEPTHSYSSAQPNPRGEDAKQARSSMYENLAPRKTFEHNAASSTHADPASRRNHGPLPKASTFLSKTESKLPGRGGGTRPLRPVSAVQSNRF